MPFAKTKKDLGLQDYFHCMMAWISVEFTLIKYIYLSLCGFESIISI